MLNSFNTIYIAVVAVSAVSSFAALIQLARSVGKSLVEPRYAVPAVFLVLVPLVDLAVLFIPAFENNTALFIGLPAIIYVAALALAVTKRWRTLLWFLPSVLAAAALSAIMVLLGLALHAGYWSPISW